MADDFAAQRRAFCYTCKLLIGDSRGLPVFHVTRIFGIQMQRRQFTLKLMFCALAAGLVTGCSQPDVASIDNENIVGSVQLEIDFQSARENLSINVPCAADSTVLSILQRAKSSGDLEFLSTGDAEFAFVKSIGGVENQAAAGDNWVYQVNGETGDRSSGVFSVKPDDHVLWVFGKYP